MYFETQTWIECYLEPGTVLRTWYGLTHLGTIIPLYTDQEIEAQRCEAACSRLHS